VAGRSDPEIAFSRSPEPGATTRLTASCWLSAGIEEVFAFFSAPGNLRELTPESVGFEILTPEPIEMAVGLQLDYRIRLMGVSLRWQSEICHLSPPFEFADRQTRGPYRYWLHRHLFEECAGGTRISDEVDYAPRGGWLVDRLVVRRQLRRIFEFRSKAIGARFG
tara:strand:- start:529 stop:1023 length:495 start_codon:yes stop_codon:yes gene_type:complete